jgi:hypothetical protein
MGRIQNVLWKLLESSPGSGLFQLRAETACGAQGEILSYDQSASCGASLVRTAVATGSLFELVPAPHPLSDPAAPNALEGGTGEFFLVARSRNAACTASYVAFNTGVVASPACVGAPTSALVLGAAPGQPGANPIRVRLHAGESNASNYPSSSLGTGVLSTVPVTTAASDFLAPAGK